MKKRLRILITNDDGIDAPGLSALAGAVKKLDSKVELWIVAPQIEQSGSSQSFTMSVPIRICPYEEERYAVSGTPSDCIVVALQHLMKDCPPDFVLSGVNVGLNIGYDVNLSGTLGATFASLMYGIPSVAISMKRAAPEKMHWDTVRDILPPLLGSLFDRGWEKYHCLSINIPNLPSEKISGSRWTRPTDGMMPPFAIKRETDLRKREHFWIYPHHHPESDTAHDSDAAALQNGYVSISVLALTRRCVLPEIAPPSLFKKPSLE